MKTHKDLEVWKDSMDLVEQIYMQTRTFPGEEKYSLVSQMRRSAVSVPSNIAEGASRYSPKEFTQFLYIGLGSLTELETQLLLSERLGYLNKKFEIFQNLEKVRAKLLGLIKYVKTKSK